jgi:recombinational DNA repair protein RecR
VTALDRLIESLSRLPGLGRKSASRIAYYLLKADASIVESLVRDMREVKERIRSCTVCTTFLGGRSPRSTGSVRRSSASTTCCGGSSKEGSAR